LGAIAAILAGISVILIYPLPYSFLCAGLCSPYGGFAGVPLNAVSKGDWLTFAYSWFFDSVTTNATQLAHWPASPIQPTALWSNVLVWLFCVVSDFVLFSGLINVWRVFWHAVTRRRRVGQES
jgi:hypothetical protein